MKKIALGIGLLAIVAGSAGPAAAVPSPVDGSAVAVIQGPAGVLIVTAFARGVTDTSETMVLALECNAVTVGVAAATEIKQCYV
ncbi:MAG: hypothetical protein ACRD1T_17445, partial [Acidimicrobiia bacterium]